MPYISFYMSDEYTSPPTQPPTTCPAANSWVTLTLAQIERKIITMADNVTSLTAEVARTKELYQRALDRIAVLEEAAAKSITPQGPVNDPAIEAEIKVLATENDEFTTDLDNDANTTLTAPVAADK